MEDQKLKARLEIRLQPEQLRKLKEEAAKKNSSVGSIVREAIDNHYKVSTKDKLAAVKKLSGLHAPVKDWEDMKKEIEAGYKNSK